MEDLNFNPDNFRDFDARLEHVDYLYNTGQMNELDKTDDVDDTLHLMDLIRKFNAKELIEYKDIITEFNFNLMLNEELCYEMTNLLVTYVEDKMALQNMILDLIKEGSITSDKIKEMFIYACKKDDILFVKHIVLNEMVQENIIFNGLKEASRKSIKTTEFLISYLDKLNKDNQIVILKNCLSDIKNKDIMELFRNYIKQKNYVDLIDIPDNNKLIEELREYANKNDFNNVKITIDKIIKTPLTGKILTELNNIMVSSFDNNFSDIAVYISEMNFYDYL